MMKRPSPVRIGSDMRYQRGSEVTFAKQFSNKRRFDSSKHVPFSTSTLRRGAIYAFILFHIWMIIVWTLPWTPAPLVIARRVVRPYMLWTGLFQSWDTFAPNPRSVDIYAKAVIFTQNHHIYTFSF